MEHELCPNCLPFKKCRFEQDTKEIADSTKMQPEKKHKIISEMRNDARDNRNCPNVNNVNPPYEGRGNL